MTDIDAMKIKALVDEVMLELRRGEVTKTKEVLLTGNGFALQIRIMPEAGVRDG